MNAATDLRPEVLRFVARVRHELSDLPEEDRDELLDGLEADLSEQMAAGDALPEPTAYAAELRSAAGLGPSVRRGRLLPRAGGLVDSVRTRWLSWTARNELTRRGWSLAEAMRPAWWVLRAWIVATLIDQVLGPWELVTLWPTLGAPLVGPLVLVVAVLVSVLVGQGRLWPGSGPERPLSARLVLVALNALAVVAPLTFTGDGSQASSYAGASGYHAGYRDASHRPGLRSGTDVVRNIYAYDAAGQPLQGVQLYDQRGRPVSVAPESSMGRGRERQVTCPWFNGSTPLFNVFPLAQRSQPRGTCLVDVDPAMAGQQGFREPPLASVPPVASP